MKFKLMYICLAIIAILIIIYGPGLDRSREAEDNSPAAPTEQIHPNAVAKSLRAAPGAIVCSDLATVGLVFNLYSEAWEDAVQDSMTNGQSRAIRGQSAPAPDPSLYGCSLLPPGTPVEAKNAGGALNGVPLVTAKLPDGTLVHGLTLPSMLSAGSTDNSSGAVACCGTSTADSSATIFTSKLTAISHTAEAITGDIEYSTDNTMTILNKRYPTNLVRALQGSEVEDAARMFSVSAPAADSSALRALYRIHIPSEDKLLNGNTICGTDSAEWVVYLTEDGKPDIWNIAFFSGDDEPNLESDANLCGTFRYQLPTQ